MTGVNHSDDRLVVLHAIKPPSSETRYANQLEAGRVDSCEYIYYTPRSVLRRRWNVLHIHWPEILIADTNVIRHVVKLVVLLFVVAKTRVTKAKVVRTVHNEVPHETIGRIDSCVVRMLDRLVDQYVVLNESQLGRDRRKPTAHIQHGHYGDVFDQHVRTSTIQRDANRFVFFGRINRYKGVGELVEAFATLDDEGLRLRVVGKPTDDLRYELEGAIRKDCRVTYDFAFIPDRQLVEEVIASSVVVLPYEEMNNSGCLLVALSLNRPVLVPRSPANEAVAREAGDAWVQMYDGDLTGEHLVAALAHARALLADSTGRPQFTGRDWSQVGRRHHELYKSIAPQRRPKLFVLLQGQGDNFGDILIRRNLLELLREYGEPNVLLGSSRDVFIPQLNSRVDDVLFESATRWYLSALYNVCFRGGSYVYKPGEIQITFGGMKEHLAVLPLALASKLSSGRMIRFGSGTRDDPSKPMVTVFRALLRLDDATYWRDRETRASVRRGDVAPDLAFYSNPTKDGLSEAGVPARHMIVVSVRGDRDKVASEWLQGLEAIAEERNSKIVSTYQVGRDRERNKALAEENSWEFIDPGLLGPETPDGERLAELYDGAEVVVSDRLHVLVFALSRGAAVVGMGTDSAGKLRRCLGVVGLAHRVVDVAGPSSVLVDAVRASLAGVGDDLVAVQSASKAVEAEFDRAFRPDSGLTRVAT